MRKRHYTAQTARRSDTVHSTNQLVGRGDIDVRGGKTGFISKRDIASRRCCASRRPGQQVAVVVLGARSNAGRFWRRGTCSTGFDQDADA